MVLTKYVLLEIGKTTYCNNKTSLYNILKKCIFLFSNSYVAVTGVPDAKPGHALIMADFALDILLRTETVLKQMSEQGLRVDSINIRIGFHSGPVVAGLLNAEKCMFELFGDTCIAANKMESSGSPGCIHVSASTANLLREGGCVHVLTRRYKDNILDWKENEEPTYWLTAQQESSQPTTTRRRSFLEFFSTERLL